MGSLHRTSKHDVVRAWAEKRNGKPSRVRGTTDALKLDFGHPDQGFAPHPVPVLETLSWDDWFAIFDEKELALQFEEPGYMCKVVKRNGHEDGAAATPEASH